MAFSLLLGLLTQPHLSLRVTPGMGAWSGWIEPAWPSGKLGGGLPCPPGPPLPLIQAWLSSLSHRVPVCWWSQGEWAGARLGQMVCARPYLLGAGRRAGARRSSCTKPALSPWQLGLRHRFCCLPALPKASHPHPQEPDTLGPPALPLQLGASPRQ